MRLLPLALVLIGAVGSAWADCTNPPGQAGFVRYAANVSMMVFCDGTNWVSMSGGANVTVGGNVNNPGGADTYVQFNSGGTAFGGSSAFTWNTGTSTLSVTNISATNLSGLLQTAAQPNITSVGTLTGLTVNGTVSATTVSGTTGYFTNLVVNGVSVTGGAQADRIISGSTKVVANSATDIVSLSTANITWGYLASSTSYLPTLAGTKVSSTNASHNTVQLVPEPITNIMGRGGNYILSGTTTVSTSSNNTIKFATDGAQRMVIDANGNVGIGLTVPATVLHISTTYPEIRFSTSASNDEILRFMQADGSERGVIRFDSSKNLRFETSGVERMRVNSAGNVGIGTTAPSFQLHVNGTAYATGAAGSLSDIRHKKNVETLSGGAIGLVQQLRPVIFEWISPTDSGMKGRQLGFIAQEVEKVLPEVVLTQANQEHTKGLKPTELLPVVVKALQELKADDDNLRRDLQASEAARKSIEAAQKADHAALEALQRQVNALAPLATDRGRAERGR